MRTIEVANLLALHKAEQVPSTLERLQGMVASQPENFTIEQSFEGTKYFINHHKAFTPYRQWLLQLFNAVEGADRNTMHAALQKTQADFLSSLQTP